MWTAFDVSDIVFAVFKGTIVVRKNLILFVSIAILAFLFLLPLVTASDEILLLDVAHPAPAQDTAVASAKLVEINWNALNEGKNRELRLNLFEGMEVAATRDRLDRPAGGGYVWVGHLLNDTNSRVVLSVVDHSLVGTISINNDEQYTIRHDGPGQILRQWDPSKQIEVEESDMVLPPDPPNGAPDKLSNCEDGSQIDLLIAYTPAAKAKTGGRAAVRALVNLRISDMNSANASSGLNFRYNLAHIMETNYQETGDVSRDLPRLKNGNDGLLDDVSRARDEYKADLTSLLVSEAKPGTSCGIAYVMNELSTNFASYAHNIVSLDYAGPNLTCSPLTLAHEFGHNLGNLHDRGSTNSKPLLPYSFGYQSPNNTFRTIMAYDCPGGCPRINYWSNPDVSFLGEPLGIDYSTRANQSADNSRSMQQTARFAANFRENCPASPPPSATSTPPPGGSPTATPPSSSAPFEFISFAPSVFSR